MSQHGFPPGFDPNTGLPLPGYAPTAPVAAPQGQAYGAPPAAGYNGMPAPHYAPPPAGYGAPVAQPFPAAAPAGGGMGLDAAPDYQGASKKFKGGFAGVVEGVSSEFKIAKNRKGVQERRCFLKFRVVEVRQNSPLDPLQPGDERTWSCLTTRPGDQQTLVALLCLMHGQNPADPAAYNAMKQNQQVQGAVAALGSTYIAGKRVTLWTEDTKTDNGFDFTVHRFDAPPRTA